MTLHCDCGRTIKVAVQQAPPKKRKARHGLSLIQAIQLEMAAGEEYTSVPDLRLLLCSRFRREVGWGETFDALGAMRTRGAAHETDEGWGLGAGRRIKKEDQ